MALDYTDAAPRGMCDACWRGGRRVYYDACREHVPQFAPAAPVYGPENRAAARFRGLKWSEDDESYVDADGRPVRGRDGRRY